MDHDSDTEFTRPSRRVPSSEGDETRPLRPPDDPENTIFSNQPAQPPAKPAGPTDVPPSPPTIRQPAMDRSPSPARRAQQTRYRGTPSPQPVPSPPRQTVVQPRPEAQAPSRPQTPWWRWAFRGLIATVLMGGLAGVLLLTVGVIGYFWFASQLPPADALRSRSFQFATTQILDREGNLLWEIIDPTGGRRTTVTLSQVDQDLINATIATEDRFFYINVGVDPIAIARAVYYNVSEGEIVSGASTITQQLARNVLINPEERTERTMIRKVKEAVLAVEINRRYSKQQILEIYLNQIYYGNLAYGIEAAAQTYFGKPAADLTLSEAALLAGLPQSPANHDPYVNPDGAKNRRADVLNLMAEAGYITLAEAEAARLEPLNLRPLGTAFEAPHFVTYVRQELEQIVPPEYIYQAGLKVQTTLDPRLQAIAEEEINNQVAVLAGRNVTNGALVAMDAENGQILAMVGSRDFRDEAIDGQVNMAISPRQPGSTMKPLTYLAAFETLNYTPGTLLLDVPVEYPDGAGGVYKPRNYDDKFHGAVSLRTALANSYNIPPIKTLEALGIDKLIAMAERLGITTLTEDYYGLSLTLGSGEVPLLEMTGAFQTMANAGKQVQPTAILKITDSFGRPIEPLRSRPKQTLRPEHAYLITHIMADNEARTPAFGPNSYLKLSRPAAAKTGTTNDFRDNWTIGYTPDIVTGVWVGNTDRSPMIDVSGLSGAGPIWHNFMERAHAGLPVTDFIRPRNIIEREVCADSGTLPSEVCPERRQEIFFRDQPPLGPEHDMHQMIEIDLNTGLRANEYCRGNVKERYFRVYPPDGWEWAIGQGIEQPPVEYCPSTSIVARISNPADGSTVRGQVTLEGSATAANYSHYQIELGVGTAPQAFAVIQQPETRLVEQGILAAFDSTQLDNGPYTIRLLVFDRLGGVVESRVRLLVDNPLPSASPTPLPTTPSPETATPTASPVPATGTPTPTPEITATNTPDILPTELPTGTPTTTTEPATPTFTATASPTVLPDTPTPTLIPTGELEPTPTMQQTPPPSPSVSANQLSETVTP
jgi:1A family penicillin-binding protein